MIQFEGPALDRADHSTEHNASHILTSDVLAPLLPQHDLPTEASPVEGSPSEGDTELPSLWDENSKKPVARSGRAIAFKKSKSKKCSKCHESKPLDQYRFYRNSHVSGHHACCKLCEKKLRMETQEDTTPTVEETAVEKERECSICKVVKCIEEFIRDSRKRTGYAASCKLCHRLSQRGAVADKCGVTSERLCKGCGLMKPPVDFNKMALLAGPNGLCRICCKTKAEPRVTQPTVSEKLCGRCGQVKAAADFTRDSRKPSGLGTRCKACEVERGRLKRQQQQEQAGWVFEGSSQALGQQMVRSPTAGPMWFDPTSADEATAPGPPAIRDQPGRAMGAFDGVAATRQPHHPIRIRLPAHHTSLHPSAPPPLVLPHLLHPSASPTGSGIAPLPMPPQHEHGPDDTLEAIFGAGAEVWQSPFVPSRLRSPLGGPKDADLAASSQMDWGGPSGSDALWAGVPAEAAPVRAMGADNDGVPAQSLHHHEPACVGPPGNVIRADPPHTQEGGAPEPSALPEKVCSRCGIVKSSAHFRQKKAGMGPYCKVCATELRREMQEAAGIVSRRSAPAAAASKGSSKGNFLSLLMQEHSPPPVRSSRPKGKGKTKQQSALAPLLLPHGAGADAGLFLSGGGSPRGFGHHDSPFLRQHHFFNQGHYMDMPVELNRERNDADNRGGPYFMGEDNGNSMVQRQWHPAQLPFTSVSPREADGGSAGGVVGGLIEGLSVGGGGTGSGLTGLDFDDSDLFLGSGDLPSPHLMSELSGQFHSPICGARNADMASAFACSSPPPVSSAWPPPRMMIGVGGLLRPPLDDLSTGGTTDSDLQRPVAQRKRSRRPSSPPDHPSGGMIPQQADNSLRTHLGGAEDGQGAGDGGDRFGVLIDTSGTKGGGGASNEGRIKLRLKLHRDRASNPTAGIINGGRSNDVNPLSPPPPRLKSIEDRQGEEQRSGNHKSAFLSGFGGASGSRLTGDAGVGQMWDLFNKGGLGPYPLMPPAPSIDAAVLPVAPSPSPQTWIPSTYGGLAAESNDEFAEFAQLYLRAYEESVGDTTASGAGVSSPRGLKGAESGGSPQFAFTGLRQHSQPLGGGSDGGGSRVGLLPSPGGPGSLLGDARGLFAVPSAVNLLMLPSPGLEFLLDAGSKSQSELGFSTEL